MMRTLTSVVAAALLVVASTAGPAAGQDKATPRPDQPASASPAGHATPDVVSAAPAKTEAKPASAADKKDAPAKPADAQKAPPKPAVPKAEPTGLERLSPDWPKWLKVNLLYRGRVESQRTLGATETPSDGYYLNRLRLGVAVQPNKWVQVAAQIHDTAVMGYGLTPTAPTSASGGFDLRTGYVEVGRKAPRGVSAAGGRMEYSLGDGRLIASPDWGNASRTYDMGRVSAFVPGFKVDVFRSAPVVIDGSKFDRVKPGEHFWGQYATFDKVPHVTLVDVYAIQKFNSVVAGETGVKGDAGVYTYGGRLLAPLGKRFSLDVDAAVQRGHMAADDVSAWAAHAAVGWMLSKKSAAKPKVTLEYDYASGDKNPKDGVKQTFDQLYASNHAKYGMADIIGFRNMEVYQVKFEASPAKKLKVNAAWNRLLLAEVTDAWYATGGSKVVLNAKATSRDIGWEPDIYASYAVSKEMTLGAGLGVLFPGDWTRQSTKISRYWYPYATWALKF